MRSMLRFISAAVLLVAGTTLACAQVRIVALGDSGVRGKGVAESEALPAQIERGLRAKGYNVTVANEGINGDTTDGVLARLNSAVPEGTQLVILSVGANDRVLRGRSTPYIMANIGEIRARLKARGVEIYVMRPMQEGIVDRADLHVETVRNPANTEWHLNARGYAIVTARILPAVEALVKKVGGKRGR